VTITRALGSGVVGAVALTLLHEGARRTVPHAPRMDILGMRAIAQGMRAVDEPPPERDRLHRWALLGDIAFNSIYYSLVATGDRQSAWRRGTLLGLLAGVGAVILPQPLGLGQPPGGQRSDTQVMTVAWYLVGGLAAAAASNLVE